MTCARTLRDLQLGVCECVCIFGGVIQTPDPRTHKAAADEIRRVIRAAAASLIRKWGASHRPNHTGRIAGESSQVGELDECRGGRFELGLVEEESVEHYARLPACVT